MSFQRSTIDRPTWFVMVCPLALVTVTFLSIGSGRLPAQDQVSGRSASEEVEYRDAVSRLRQDLDSGTKSLDWDPEFGWLPKLLQVLEIPSSSQVLVFSKTSLQNRKISPSTPRAIFFNDHTYVGYVQRGDVIEIASVDPVHGAVFYTLDQTNSENVQLQQKSSQCLACHESHKTQNVPGFLVRSVFPKRNGHPEFRLGTTHTDHRTPFVERFGGWYVTGDHGTMRHRGNGFAKPESNDTQLAMDWDANANRKELPKIARPQRHLEPTSDIVALMLLEHQSQFHNYVAKASIETRAALEYQKQMNEILSRPSDFQSESTQRRIRSSARELVEYLFFADEFPLQSKIQGSEKFREDFRTAARRDARGRSLRDLDLSRRLLKYPCSYLVYSEAFCNLPEPVLTIVLEQMREVLAGKGDAESFGHLDEPTREAILQILQETHPLFQPKTPTQ